MHHNYTAKSIGPFILEAPIGKGAMGEVWKARHSVSQTTVAIKVLLPQIAMDPWAKDAFMTEIRSAACLTHPNAIMVLDNGVIDDDVTAPL